MSRGVWLLVECAVDYQDGDLWGCVVLKKSDESTTLYKQCLPCADFPEPPGWSHIAELTGITAEVVRANWSDDGLQNPAATEAFRRLYERCGYAFLCSEVPNVVKDELAVELTPMTDASLIDNAPDEPIGADPQPAAPKRYATVTAVTAELQANVPTITVHTEGDAYCAFIVPNRGDPDPESWFLVETIYGHHAATVEEAWETGAGTAENALAQYACVQLSESLFGRTVELKDDNIDTEALRKQLVLELLSKQRQPACYVSRPTKNVIEQTWLLLEDVLGQTLLRYQALKGQSSGIPAVIRTVEGSHKLEVLDTPEKLRGVLLHCIDFRTPGKRPKHIAPPPVVVDHLRTFARQDIPPIDALSRIPTVRRDGSIHITAGYDRASKVWYAPDQRVAEVPDNPTDAEIKKAIQLLVYPFADFPLREESGALSAVIACLLEQIMRPMIDGPRPLWVFDAPSFRGAGSGKSLVAKVIATIIAGYDVPITTWPEDPKELPKLITTKLLSGEQFVIFDNLSGTVRHRDLAALATSTAWSSRLLHSNEGPTLPQTATWALTLNGAKFDRDIARRAVTIRLDTGSADPYKRTNWRIKGSLTGWALKNRAGLIRAALILVRGWVAAGQPKDPSLRMGSFEGWAETVGGVVHYAGLTGLPRAIAESHERDTDVSEHELFIQNWWARYGAQLVTASALVDLAIELGLYPDELAKTSPSWRARRLVGIIDGLDASTFTTAAGPKAVVKAPTLMNGYRRWALVTPGQPGEILPMVYN